MWYYNSDHPLRHYFTGLTEQTFMADLGVADPPLIDYLSTLLSRFVHIDSIYKLRTGAGKRLEEVADMLMEVEELPPEGRTSREVHRHIGDFTLFWTGVYPEVLKRHRAQLPEMDLFAVTVVAKDWDEAQQKFFADNGVFDVIHPGKARQ